MPQILCKNCRWFKSHGKGTNAGSCLVHPQIIQNKPATHFCSLFDPKQFEGRPCVVIESPFSATTDAQRKAYDLYLHAAMIDSMNRGEAPYASHALYTQFLDDDNLDYRDLGIEMGLDWGDHCDAVAIYLDFGMSSGMKMGKERAEARGVSIDNRTILDKPINWKGHLARYEKKLITSDLLDQYAKAKTL